MRAAKSVLTRTLDGVDPGLVGEIRHAAEHVDGLNKLLEVEVRWLGHRLHADVAVLVDNTLSIAKADRFGGQIKRALFAHIPALSVANVRIHGANPAGADARSAAHVDGRHAGAQAFKIVRPSRRDVRA